MLCFIIVVGGDSVIFEKGIFDCGIIKTTLQIAILWCNCDIKFAILRKTRITKFAILS